MSVVQMPRAVRPVPDPMALYIRAGRNDHLLLTEQIARGGAALFGVVFDPTNVDRHSELLDTVQKNHIDAMLDTRAAAAATPGGFTDRLGDLPWGVGRQETYSDFEGRSATERIAAIADFVLQNGFSQVLAPSHYIKNADDNWLQIDLNSAHRLRKALDLRGGSHVQIVYPLIVPYALLRNPTQRKEIAARLASAPVAAIWLRVDGFGADKGGSAVKNYLEAAADFHSLNLPLVADHLGGFAGLSLMAFGAVGGIAHGVTLGERFGAANWFKEPDGEPFSPSHRVYLHTIDLMLDRLDARTLIEKSSRTRALFACDNPHCCPRGLPDMLREPGRHFLKQRMNQVSFLSLAPAHLRAAEFVEHRIRPASDKAVAAASLNSLEDHLFKTMERNRKRLETLRMTLGAIVHEGVRRTTAPLPRTLSARTQRR
jgi:hypothetical protein